MCVSTRVVCLMHLLVVCPTLLTWPGANVGERREIYRWGRYLVGIVLIGTHTVLYIDLLHVHSCEFHTPTSPCHTRCMTWRYGVAICKGCVERWYAGLCPRYGGLFH